MPTQFSREFDSDSLRIRDRIRRVRFRVSVAVTFLSLFGAVLPSTAQTPKTVGRKSSDGVPPITIGSIEALRKMAVDSPGITAAVKKQIGVTYDTAVSRLKAVEQLESQTAAMQKELDAGPADLKKIQLQLTGESKWVAVDTSKWILQALQERTREAEAAVAAAKQETSRILTEIDRRTGRRAMLPELIATAKKHLDATGKLLQSPSPKDEPAAVSAANRTLHLVVRQVSNFW